MLNRLREKLSLEVGFTLIELMLVVAVLGILAGIAVPRITGVQDEALKGMLESNATTIRNAMERERAMEGSYPNLGSVSTLSDLSGALQTTDLAIDPDKVSLLSAGLDTDHDGETRDYVIEIEDSDSKFKAIILPNDINVQAQ